MRKRKKDAITSARASVGGRSLSLYHFVCVCVCVCVCVSVYVSKCGASGDRVFFLFQKLLFFVFFDFCVFTSLLLLQKHERVFKKRERETLSHMNLTINERR